MYLSLPWPRGYAFQMLASFAHCHDCSLEPNMPHCRHSNVLGFAHEQLLPATTIFYACFIREQACCPCWGISAPFNCSDASPFGSNHMTKFIWEHLGRRATYQMKSPAVGHLGNMHSPYRAAALLQKAQSPMAGSKTFPVTIEVGDPHKLVSAKTSSLRSQAYLSSTVVAIPSNSSSPRGRAHVSPTLSHTAVYSPRGYSSDDRRPTHFSHYPGQQAHSRGRRAQEVPHAACKHVKPLPEATAHPAGLVHLRMH